MNGNIDSLDVQNWSVEPCETETDSFVLSHSSGEEIIRVTTSPEPLEEQLERYFIEQVNTEHGVTSEVGIEDTLSEATAVAVEYVQANPNGCDTTTRDRH